MGIRSPTRESHTVGEPSDAGTGNQTQLICKNRKHSERLSQVFQRYLSLNQVSVCVYVCKHECDTPGGQKWVADLLGLGLSLQDRRSEMTELSFQPHPPKCCHFMLSCSELSELQGRGELC